MLGRGATLIIGGLAPFPFLRSGTSLFSATAPVCLKGKVLGHRYPSNEDELAEAGGRPALIRLVFWRGLPQMKRSCCALTWLLGMMACGLLVVGHATGQIPPKGPAPLPASADENRCPQPTEAPRPGATDVSEQAATPAGWSLGPLGLLPYDHEYNCDIPSENPAGLPEPAISALVVQQELDDELPSLSLFAPIGDRPTAWAGDEPSAATNRLSEPASEVADGGDAEQQVGSSLVASDAAEYGAWESLPFRVLGFGPAEIAGVEEASESLEDIENQELSATHRQAGAGLLRGLGRSLIACGQWFSATASTLEQGIGEGEQDE